MFGYWSIDESLFNWLKNNLESGKILLELGSGLTTEILCKIYDLYSVEENIELINKYHNNYIYAPIKNNWYDLEILKNNLPLKVDAILIDGPAHGERKGFFNNIELFLNLNPSLLIFDDVERKEDYESYLSIVNYLKINKFNIETEIFSDIKKFAILKINE